MIPILRMDDYRPDPHVTINTGEAVHVYPLSYLQAFAAGETVEELLPEDVQRAIVREWLALLPEAECNP